MPTVIAGTWECTQRLALTGGEEAVNVFHVDDNAATLNQATADAISGIFETAWEDHLKSFTFSGNEYSRFTTKDISTANGAAFDTLWSVPGTVGTDPLPNGVAAVVTWRTSLTGKSFRGRSYVGGFCESGSSGNSPTSSLTTALNAWSQQLIDDFSAASHPLGVGSRTLQQFNEITTRQVRAAWHSQRRRNLKG
jgi:hypothetical protein